MDFQKFSDWAFKGIITGGVVFCVNFMGRISTSVEKLNIQMGQNLERSEWQQKAIDEEKEQNKIQNERLLKLEQRNK